MTENHNLLVCENGNDQLEGRRGGIMRTTEGKPTVDIQAYGDKELAEKLGMAVAAVDVPDRYAHGFHTYPASLHPDAARDLIAIFGGKTALDPFVGGGTTLVEARAAGMQTFGHDASPVAIRVARARTATPSDELLTKFRRASRDYTASARAAGRRDSWPDDWRLDEIGDWYGVDALIELESLRRDISDCDPEVRFLLEAAFSSILVKVSWRKSDTSQQRVVHRRPRGTTAVLFHKKCRELARKLVAYREAVPEGTDIANLSVCDARRLTSRGPGIDLAITSPPYPATYDYLPLQHLREVWFNTRADRAMELGARRDWRRGGKRAEKLWRTDTHDWTAAVARRLNKRGVLLVVIGDGRTPAGEIDALRPTIDAGSEAGLKLMAAASLRRPDHAHDGWRWEHVVAMTPKRGK